MATFFRKYRQRFPVMVITALWLILMTGSGPVHAEAAGLFDIFLPVVGKNIYAGIWEGEPNNVYSNANGPLLPGRVYFGRADDAKDYYRLYLPVAGKLALILDHPAAGAQILLYHNSVLNQPLVVNAAPYQFNLPSADVGWYYLQVYTPPQGIDFDHIYTLRAEYESGLVYIPSGSFQMGCDPAHNNGYACPSSELPLHQVFLSDYWIEKTEVTNAMFANFVQASGYQTDAETLGGGWVWQTTFWVYMNGASWQHPKGASSDLTGRMQMPVTQISYNDAQAYCNWIGRRVPTEAEWEKAARGVQDTRPYPWGEAAPVCAWVNYQDISSCYGDTSNVASFPNGATPNGIMDMAGNVWEWVNDWYSPGYYSVSPGSNPTGPASGTMRLLRGGSWINNGLDIRTSKRGESAPENRYDAYGFRCAMTSP
ncbi:MAG TPA: formylglycine-generating enzyme family protein [Anaerolineaceae bacterium]|nr:formylglycine-generating enzyme family protein [Anaerolineaceae bacterium]HPN53883.1 formylglycine-generating enzyme family protein [Anaerolineaceae bacterium]